MRPSFERDFAWQRDYLPALKRIAGEHLISEAPAEEDQLHNTDLMVLRLEAFRIACRVRQHKYVARYGHEFTIRCTRPSGMETELAKLVSGWGNYLIYGFADEHAGDLCAWVLGDLDVFRSWRKVERFVGPPSDPEPGVLRHNPDGSADFRAYAIADLPPTFVVARRRVSELTSA